MFNFYIYFDLHEKVLGKIFGQISFSSKNYKDVENSELIYNTRVKIRVGSCLFFFIEVTFLISFFPLCSNYYPHSLMATFYQGQTMTAEGGMTHIEINNKYMQW